jgi:hypothetical protein
MLGFLLVLAGATAASLPGDKWAEWVARAGEPWTTESCRWILASVFIIAGVSFLSAKPFFYLITSALVMLTAYCLDVIIGGKLSACINTAVGSDVAGRVLPVAALALGYLIHTSPRARVPSTTGVFSLVLIGFAGVGVVYGWYPQSLNAVAPRFGEGARKFVAEWSEECTWAMALILAAIGVAASRTKTVHFLSAILLGALAYHCIQSGCKEVVSFPTTNGISIPDIETSSLANVAMWRWIAAGELVLLGIILLHLSLGMGALNVAFALFWMLGGVAAYQEVGKLSLVRLAAQGVAQSAASTATNKAVGQPLGMWGLPLADPRTQAQQAHGPAGKQTPDRDSMKRAAPQPPSAQELEKARAEAQASIRQNGPSDIAVQGLVREIGPLVWMYLTAILAGILGITGFRMLSNSGTYRFGLMLLLLVAFVAGCTWLGTKWPRDPEQSWLSWAAAFRESRYHVYLIWLVFLGCMALAGIGALLLSARTTPWIHASIYSTFIGTILTLVGVAVLIRFGGFPRLPVWTYIAIAAGQSSMAWVLLMHLSLSGRSDRQGS